MRLVSNEIERKSILKPHASSLLAKSCCSGSFNTYFTFSKVNVNLNERGCYNSCNSPKERSPLTLDNDDTPNREVGTFMPAIRVLLTAADFSCLVPFKGP